MNARGFGLLEVLVSLLVIGIGLLGAMALMTRGQQAEVESYQRAQALILAEDMASRINANRSAAGCYTITTNTSDGTPYAGHGSNAANLSCAGVGTTTTRATADADLAAWDELLKGASETLDGNNAGGLVQARGCILEDPATEEYTIAVVWQGLSESAAPAVSCANGLYDEAGKDGRRRAVTHTIRIADLS